MDKSKKESQKRKNRRKKQQISGQNANPLSVSTEYGTCMPHTQPSNGLPLRGADSRPIQSLVNNQLSRQNQTRGFDQSQLDHLKKDTQPHHTELSETKIRESYGNRGGRDHVGRDFPYRNDLQVSPYDRQPLPTRERDSAALLINFLADHSNRVKLQDLERSNKQYIRNIKSWNRSGKVETFLGDHPEMFILSRGGSGGVGDIVVSYNLQLDMCEKFLSGSCQQKCFKLHICKYYLMKSCTSKQCKHGHDLNDSHNQEVLNRNCVHKMGFERLRQEILATRHDVATPSLCAYYNGSSGCGKNSGCTFLHICKHYIADKCRYIQRCKRSHDLFNGQPHAVLVRHGFKKYLDNGNKAQLLQLIRNETLTQEQATGDDYDNDNDDSIGFDCYPGYSGSRKQGRNRPGTAVDEDYDNKRRFAPNSQTNSQLSKQNQAGKQINSSGIRKSVDNKQLPKKGIPDTRNGESNGSKNGGNQGRRKSANNQDKSSGFRDSVALLINFLADNGNRVELKDLEMSRKGYIKDIKSISRDGKVETFLMDHSDTFVVTHQEVKGQRSMVVSYDLQLDICEDYFSGSCQQECLKLHICKFYLMQTCTRTQCKYGHNLNTEHNMDILKRRYAHRMGIERIGREIMATRKDVALPVVCSYYNRPSGCDKNSKCAFLHICKHLIAGNCKYSHQCRNNHDLFNGQPYGVLVRYGFKEHLDNGDEDKLLQLIRNEDNCKSPKQNQAIGGVTDVDNDDVDYYENGDYYEDDDYYEDETDDEHDNDADDDDTDDDGDGGVEWWMTSKYSEYSGPFDKDVEKQIELWYQDYLQAKCRVVEINGEKMRLCFDTMKGFPENGDIEIDINRMKLK